MAFFCGFILSISPPPTCCNLPQSPPPRLLTQLRPPASKLIRMVMASSSRRGTIPARDMAIDFGKYRGRLLGTLPSSYLKWVSKNLRARDYQEWADRADEVLADPFYADRIEWEHAQRILTGNDVSRVAGTRIHSNSFTQKPASDLLDISRRFGWDNDDKAGWGKVDFELLGTSKGGRIPRLKDKQRSGGAVPYPDDGGSRRLSSSSSPSSIESNGDSDNVTLGVERRRELRRERQRTRKPEDGGVLVHQQEQRSVKSSSYSSSSPEGERRNPFPGRQAILRKLGSTKNDG